MAARSVLGKQAGSLTGCCVKDRSGKRANERSECVLAADSLTLVAPRNKGYAQKKDHIILPERSTDSSRTVYSTGV